MSKLLDKKVVVIGGGTGNFVMLSELKKRTKQITALVNMADNGGSTGVLRDELGVLPPGDVRQCLVALAEAGSEMRELFNYRFEKGLMRGHAFGNLFLSAMESKTGSFIDGVRLAGKLLNIVGKIEPVTLTHMNLVMENEKGEIIEGEAKICLESFDGMRSRFWLVPNASINLGATRAIMNADVVIISPGNLYTSLVPALLAEGIGTALRTTKAKCFYVCNLMSKPNQTKGYTPCDFALELSRIVGGDFLDYVLVNKKIPREELVEKYALEGEELIKDDGLKLGGLFSKKCNFVFGDLIADEAWVGGGKSDPLAGQRTFIRHNAEAVFDLVESLI